ncbi:unnamed protein product [Closterium sp. NIES-53]
MPSRSEGVQRLEEVDVRDQLESSSEDDGVDDDDVPIVRDSVKEPEEGEAADAEEHEDGEMGQKGEGTERDATDLVRENGGEPRARAEVDRFSVGRGEGVRHQREKVGAYCSPEPRERYGKRGLRAMGMRRSPEPYEGGDRHERDARSEREEGGRSRADADDRQQRGNEHREERRGLLQGKSEAEKTPEDGVRRRKEEEEQRYEVRRQEREIETESESEEEYDRARRRHGKQDQRKDGESPKARGQRRERREESRAKASERRSPSPRWQGRSERVREGSRGARAAREGIERALYGGSTKSRRSGARGREYGHPAREESGTWETGRWSAAAMPRVEMPVRLTGDIGTGSNLRNYLMQIGNVKYRCDRSGMDPIEFFLSLPNTLGGEAETLYRMKMKEWLRRAEEDDEDPTILFLERLRKQFPGHTAERIREFQEFRRGKTESLLTYYGRLMNLAEDVVCTDSSMLISKFLGDWTRG